MCLPTDVQGNFDVFLRGQGRDQVEGLEDHANLAVAHHCQFAFAHARDIDAVDQHLPGGWIVETGDDAQQGTFAGTGRPHDGDKLAAQNLKTDALEDIDALATEGQALGDVLHIHDNCAFCFSGLLAFKHNCCVHMVSASLSLVLYVGQSLTCLKHKRKAGFCDAPGGVLWVGLWTG